MEFAVVVILGVLAFGLVMSTVLEIGEWIYFKAINRDWFGRDWFEKNGD